MTSIQPSAFSPAAPNTINASQSGRAGSPSAAGTSSPPPVTLTQPTIRSYANATKKPSSPPTIASSSVAPSVAVTDYQHGPRELVNGRNAIVVGAPPIVNSNVGANGGYNISSDHNKKPSVTISAAGASGYMLNNGSSAPSTRPNIVFGSTNADASPAIASSVPYQSQTSPLPRPQSNPRITSPAKSPSPIPQPQPSGGRPPPVFQGQGNAPSFGDLGVMSGDMNRQMRGTPQASQMPNQPIHLRPESSQGSDMGNPGMPYGNQGPNRNNYMARGASRPNFGPSFTQQMPYPSPAQSYRAMPGQQRGGPNIPPHFQTHMGPHPNSPHLQPRSPGLSGSHPTTPQMQSMQVVNNQQMQYPPSYAAYAQHLGPQPGQFGIQPPFDPAYAYFQAPYQMPPQYLQHGIPSSPRAFKQMPPTSHQQYMQAQYAQPPSQNMSRTSSQVSERPASSLGGTGQQHQGPGPATSVHPISAPNQSTRDTGATSANFTIPSKEKKGIVIKKPDGEVVTFEKKPPTPSPIVVQPPSPAQHTSTPTPPPRSASTTSHTRSDSKSGRSAAEIRAEFLENVKSGMADEKPILEEDNAKDLQEIHDAAEKARVEHLQSEAKAAKQKEDEDARELLEKQEAVAKAARDAEAIATSQAEAEAETEAARIDAERAKTETDVQQAQDSTATAKPDESEDERARREKEEEDERMIAEMEAAEQAELERERAYAEKKKMADAEKAVKAKEEAAKTDEEMRRLEREAEAAEEARALEKSKAQAENHEDPKTESEDLFAALKKPTLGPGAEGEAATPVSQDATPPPIPADVSPPTSVSRTVTANKPKPAALKLEMAKSVEPPQPTPGMQALKSARLLDLRKESITYPEGISSPNPALNQSGKKMGRSYDTQFLMQFKDAFREKPSPDWDQKLKDTVSDTADSAGPKSARTPAGGMGSRSASTRGPPPSSFPTGGLGSFGNQARPLPPGTTSADRFMVSSQRLPMVGVMPGYNPAPARAGGFPMPGVMGGPRGGPLPPAMSNRGPGTSQRGSNKPGRVDSRQDRKEMQKQNQAMPLTANADLKPLEVSKSGWKPLSITKPALSNAVDPSGHMPPDMVQRKVKASLNKMTPERFDKIADQILTIAAQSKDETDGRTLRQVIALTFEKACDEAHWASMYASFCKRMLQEMSPEIMDETIRDKNDQPVVGGPLFRKYLLNRCQEEFEHGWEANLPEKPEGEIKEAAMLSDEYYVAEAAKRKGLGLIQFIGELYKLGMLSIKIMHQCVLKLLNFEGMPDESAIESLVKLLRTVGGPMSQAEQGPALLISYFDRIDMIMKMPGLPSRMHFMLLDTVDLRKAGWHSKDDTKGPKTIQQIRDEAALAQQQADLERARQNARGGTGGGGRIVQGRGDVRNFSGSQMPPPDYGRNQVGSDDLRKLARVASSRNATAKSATLGPGPTSMFTSRSSSGRPGLGPTAAFGRGEESSGSSRNASQKAERKEDTSVNAFSALAVLDTGDGAESTPGSSPPVAKVQPAAPVSDSNNSKPEELPKVDLPTSNDT